MNSSQRLVSLIQALDKLDDAAKTRGDDDPVSVYMSAKKWSDSPYEREGDDIRYISSSWQRSAFGNDVEDFLDRNLAHRHQRSRVTAVKHQFPVLRDPEEIEEFDSIM